MCVSATCLKSGDQAAGAPHRVQNFALGRDGLRHDAHSIGPLLIEVVSASRRWARTGAKPLFTRPSSIFPPSRSKRIWSEAGTPNLKVQKPVRPLIASR